MLDKFPVTETLITVFATIGATALAALLKVWLENKRLTKKDYRKTMSDRIEQLEEVVSNLQFQRAIDRETIGRLEAEVKYLRSPHAPSNRPSQPG